MAGSQSLQALTEELAQVERDMEKNSQLQYLVFQNTPDGKITEEEKERLGSLRERGRSLAEERRTLEERIRTL